MKLFYLITILLFSSQSFARLGPSSEYYCLQRIKSTLAPYINLPEYRGAFENKQLNEVEGVNAFYWDRVDGDRTTRYFSTDKGNYKCNFDSNLADRVRLNPEVLNSLNSENSSGRIRDLMVTTGYSVRSLLATEYTFNCTRQSNYAGVDSPDQNNSSRSMIDHYLSWSTQLYNEDLIANGTTVGGLPNSPSQFMFRIRQSCWEVPDPDGVKFIRKLESRERDMSRVFASHNGVQSPRAYTAPVQTSGAIIER